MKSRNEGSGVVSEPRPRQVFTTQFSPLEINTLLRSLATANDAERTSKEDRTVNTWLAERLLRLLGEGA